jgi:hypothetical protein
MFNYLFKNKSKLVLTEKLLFIKLLNKLSEILVFENHLDHKLVINKLLCFLKENEINSFVNYLKSGDIWGGAGAVWEVGFKSKQKEFEFYNCMISLINLMDKIGLANFNIRRIKTIYKNQIDKFEQ